MRQLINYVVSCAPRPHHTTPHHSVSAVEELTFTGSVGEDSAGLTPAVFVVSLDYAVVTLSSRHISHQPHHPLIRDRNIIAEIKGSANKEPSLLSPPS